MFELGTGLRRGELLKLKIECVNLSDRIAHVFAMDQTIEIPPDCLVVPERKSILQRVKLREGADLRGQKNKKAWPGYSATLHGRAAQDQRYVASVQLL